MGFPLPPLSLDFGTQASFQTSIDTAPISNEAFTGAFNVGAGSARTDSQFSPDQTTERNAPGISGGMGGGAFPMELVYAGVFLIVSLIAIKKVLK